MSLILCVLENSAVLKVCSRGLWASPRPFHKVHKIIARYYNILCLPKMCLCKAEVLFFRYFNQSKKSQQMECRSRYVIQMSSIRLVI